MKKWQVYGTVSVSVGMKVEAETKEEAIEKASEEWEGIGGFCGNGGTNKLIGVYGEDCSIEEGGSHPEFTDAYED